jgi:hypothetical protein
MCGGRGVDSGALIAKVRQSAGDAVCADHRPVGGCRPAGAALADGRDELAECGERGQRIVIVVEHGYMYEAGSVIEPDGM